MVNTHGGVRLKYNNETVIHKTSTMNDMRYIIPDMLVYNTSVNTCNCFAVYKYLMVNM